MVASQSQNIIGEGGAPWQAAPVDGELEGLILRGKREKENARLLEISLNVSIVESVACRRWGRRRDGYLRDVSQSSVKFYPRPPRH